MQYRLAMGLKKHLPLIVGIGVPVLMILFIIGSIIRTKNAAYFIISRVFE